MNRELYKYEREDFFSCGGMGRGLCLYNEKGQRLNIYYGNNTKTRYYYNVLNFRLERILTTRNAGQDILQDLNYEFDAVGNITKTTDDAQQTHYFNNQVIAPVSTYEYDALYRLTKATGRELTALTAPTHEDFANDIPCPDVAGNAMQNYLHNYQYDALGNMLSDNWKDYVYDTQTNRLLKHDALQNLDDYSYDAHGNMLTMPHLTNLQWNCKDEMTSATNGTFVSYYNYDAQGNRTRKVVEKGNVREERYYVNGYEVFRKYVSNSLKFERVSCSVYSINVSQEELPTENENDKPQVITKYEIDTYNKILLVETKTIENGQTIISPTTVVRYQYSNHLGSACLELDENGYIISYEEYHPFGTTSYRSGKNDAEVSQKKYKYCGKERDEEIGLYYYGARYYAAWLCRFISTDPLKEKYPNWSPYVYSYNNPIRFFDPTGLYGLEGIDGEQSYTVIAVFQEQYQNAEALKTQIEKLRAIGRRDDANNLEAIYDAIQVARSEKMPIMFVKNIGDFADAMKDLGTMGSSADIYSLNSHGRDGFFRIGEDEITKDTDVSALKNGLGDKTVFIYACQVAAGREGKQLIERFSKETSSTVIGSEQNLDAGYYYRGGPKLNDWGSTFYMSNNGSKVFPIYDVSIEKNRCGGNINFYLTNPNSNPSGKEIYTKPI